MSKKYIVIGDIHLGVKGDDISLFIDLIVKLVLPLCDKDTIVIFTGDQFDNKYGISTVLLSKIIKIFKTISETVGECHFLIGNHDTWKYKESMETNMSTIFSLCSNFYIHYDEEVDIYGHSFHFISFNHKTEEIEKSIEKSTSKYLILHEDIECFMYDNHRKITSGINFGLLKKFKVVFNGHIHKKQTIENVYNVGAPYQLRFNDVGNLCGIHILDVETDDVEFIENTHYSKYVKITQSEFIENQDNVDFTNKHVWVTEVTDSKVVETQLQETQPSYLRVGMKKVDTQQGSEVFVYEHDDNSIPVSEYLSSIEEIPINGEVVNISNDVKLREELIKLSEEL